MTEISFRDGSVVVPGLLLLLWACLDTVDESLGAHGHQEGDEEQQPGLCGACRVFRTGPPKLPHGGPCIEASQLLYESGPSFGAAMYSAF